MERTNGPRVRLALSCSDCVHVVSVSYRLQGDSGHDVYCTFHSKAPVERRRVGDTTWETPSWCPLRKEAVLAFVKSAGVVEADALLLQQAIEKEPNTKESSDV